MGDLLGLAAALLFVLVLVWGARRFYYRGPQTFYLDGEKYGRHGDGHFVTGAGGRVADPERLSVLAEQWSLLTHAHNPDGRRPRATWRPHVPFDPGAKRPKRSRLSEFLDALGSFGH